MLGTSRAFSVCTRASLRNACALSARLALFFAMCPHERGVVAAFDAGQLEEPATRVPASCALSCCATRAKATSYVDGRARELVRLRQLVALAVIIAQVLRAHP
eukprot:460493-Alexandrium_andersonii.AAC.1